MVVYTWRILLTVVGWPMTIHVIEEQDDAERDNMSNKFVNKRWPNAFYTFIFIRCASFELYSKVYRAPVCWTIIYVRISSDKLLINYVLRYTSTQCIPLKKFAKRFKPFTVFLVIVLWWRRDATLRIKTGKLYH